MTLKPDQDRIKSLLSETITLLCRNGLNFKAELTVEALIGITLDHSDVFLVSIKETVQSVQAATSSSELVSTVDGQHNRDGDTKTFRGVKRDMAGFRAGRRFDSSKYSRNSLQQSGLSLSSRELRDVSREMPVREMTKQRNAALGGDDDACGVSNVKRARISSVTRVGDEEEQISNRGEKGHIIKDDDENVCILIWSFCN